MRRITQSPQRVQSAHGRDLDPRAEHVAGRATETAPRNEGDQRSSDNRSSRKGKAT